MGDNDIDLRSVNWEHGMLLTPEHFLRQERYVDSAFLWILRYCTNAYGLVGAGPRIDPVERGAAKHDPIAEILEDTETIRVTVSQCRGITATGDLIDIDPTHAVHGTFSKQELSGRNELGVYVVCQPHRKELDNQFEDPANPQMRSARRWSYQVKLDVNAGEAQHSLLLTGLRKSETSLRWERTRGFIPPCTTLAGHSELMQAWRQLQERVGRLAERYAELHRAILEYISLANERGIDTREDAETLSFVSRMVLALEDCVYETLDPLQSPQTFFQQMYRAIRSSALYLDLSPPTREYFRMLGTAGETEFLPLLEQERQALQMNRDWTIRDNLSVDVQRVAQSLHRLQRLEEALEGKYIDFRISPSLEALNFVFDRGGEAFYQIIGKPSHPQVFGQDLTFVFARLKLEERQHYRIILVGEPEAHFERGEAISAEIRINPGGGQSLKPLYKTSYCEVVGQRNFAVDFETPDVLSISDLRVVVKATHPIRSGLLYIRRRFYKVRERASTAPTPETDPTKPEEQRRPSRLESTPDPAFSPSGGARGTSRLSEESPSSRPGEDRSGWTSSPAKPPRRSRLE